MANEDKIPVIEFYGPVLQGEGMVIGKPTWFVRLGGCDYRCYYCDSMHAVDGAEIEKRKTIMSAEELADKTLKDMGSCPMVTLSGGNPALWPMNSFVLAMRRAHKEVAVETQGSVWALWLTNCNYVTLSPKGPGMVDTATVLKGKTSLLSILRLLLNCSQLLPNISVKIPIFDSSDLEFASAVRDEMDYLGFDDIPMFLSVGNTWVPKPAELGIELPPDPHLQREALLSKLDKISKIVYAQYPLLMRCAILPQLHVLQFGNELGR